MTKKLILPALACMFAALFATNSSAQTCSGFTGQNVQYMGVGSSAQFNSFAFAAENLLNSAGNGFNFWASSSFKLEDYRATTVDSGKIWVAWDNSSDCKVYAYVSVDSTIGVKSFYAWQKLTENGVTNADVSAAFGQAGQSFASCSLTTPPNAGQPLCTTATLPSGIQTFLTTQPGPSCKISGTTCTSGTVGALPRPYCGQNSTVQTTAKYCFWNAGHADVRPEDTLYATTRALSAYNTTNGLSGLGYDQIGSSAPGCGASTTKIGCPVYESFGQGGVFYVNDFALSGTDPITLASIPTTITMNIGAAPVVVFVNDADSAGFGAGAPSYTVTNINHKVLAGFEDGTFSCTGDVQNNVLPPTFGSGQPVQVVQREILSGTYNTFEFTGVRTLSGSATTAISEHTVSTSSWLSDDDSGQELNNDPSTNYNNGGTCQPGGSIVPTGLCGDPKYVPTKACGSNGNGVQLRAIGTGEEVKATLDVAFTGQSSSGVATPDGLGYAFWGYGNFAPAATGCGTNSGSVACSSYLGHYLTVDGIDPLFNNPGDATNPNGSYHLPQCYLKSGLPNCFAIPFTHIYDGSYPLWTVLRAVTFSTVGTTQTTPVAVVSMIAEAEKVAGDSTKNLDDFVPFFTNINSTDTKGDLNLPVFRSHYKQSLINPDNGHYACADSFTGITLTPAANGCLVETGGDVGGSVFTVQADADFYTDFGSLGSPNPKELYGLHQ